MRLALKRTPKRPSAAPTGNEGASRLLSILGPVLIGNAGNTHGSKARMAVGPGGTTRVPMTAPLELHPNGTSAGIQYRLEPFANTVGVGFERQVEQVSTGDEHEIQDQVHKQV